MRVMQLIARKPMPENGSNVGRDFGSISDRELICFVLRKHECTTDIICLCCFLFRFWMKKTFVKVWSVYDMREDEVDLRSRTSNGIERYNKRMGREVFTTAHPNLHSFVKSLKDETERVERRIEDVQNSRERAAPYQGRDCFPDIPDDYEDFRGFSQSPKKKRSKRLTTKNTRVAKPVAKKSDKHKTAKKASSKIGRKKA